MQFKYILTDKEQKHLLKEVSFDLLKGNGGKSIAVDDKQTFQTFKGFGGAFTQSSAYNLKRVASHVKEEALKAYFDKENGLGYVCGRMAMASSDFGLLPYDYVKENDVTLESFDISIEDEYTIPLIKEASKIAGENIPILISPWSPSAWMKDNNSRIRGGHLKREYYDVWANYYVKFINELRKRNINVVSLTVQNEPAAVQRWDSCIYTPEEERDFLMISLLPALRSNKIDLPVYIWDHNKDIVLERVEPIYKSKIAGDIKGTAIHWYDNEQYQNLAKHFELYPDKEIIFTEGCIEGGPHFDYYEGGERYGRNIIRSLENYVTTYIDWNLFLDERGGPNWVNNNCDSPVMLFVNQDKVYYSYSYYYIGQFSKYIKPGYVRVKTNNDSDVLVTSFKSPEGRITVVLQNEQDKEIELSLKIKEEVLNIKLLKHSILTIVEE